MSGKKDGRLWIVNGFQLGIPLGVNVGIIPVFLTRGWSNVWLPFLAVSVWLLIPLVIVSSYKHTCDLPGSVWEKPEVNKLLLGFGVGAMAAASVVLIEFFAVQGVLVIGAILLVGFRIVQWTKL